MPIGTPPDTDVARVQRWCRRRVPEDIRHELRVECEVSGRDITIVERHPAWRSHSGSEWMTEPVARLRYLKSRGVWQLYRPGRDDRWHTYPELPWARTVQQLLDEIDRDPTSLFWG
jgi:hypothetical protein